MLSIRTLRALQAEVDAEGISGSSESCLAFSGIVRVAADSGVLEEHLELHPGNEVPASAISISNLSAKPTLGRPLPAALRRLLDEGGPELA